jgi:hypothetical protein
MELGLTRSLASYSLLSLSKKLLDEIGGGAMALSLRKLSDDASNTAIRVRRSTDNVEVYVSFDSDDEVSTNSPIANVSGTPNTTATTLGAFLSEASSPDLHVVTWYDQSGNGNDFTNSVTSTQPKIASSGSYLGYIDFDSDFEVLSNTSVSGIPSGDQSYHLVQAEGAAAPTTFNITFWNLGFSHYIYYGSTQVTSGFSVGNSTGAAITRGEFNQFSVLGSLSPNQQITTRNTLAYSNANGVSGNPPALFTARLGQGWLADVNSQFKIKELIFLNTVDSDIVSEVSSSQTTYFGTPD